VTQPITYYVDVSVSTTGTGPQPAGFGVPMFLYEHALEDDRLAGPFTSAADVLDEGHASGSPPHLWAQALMRQSPRVKQFYIGRRDSADADIGAALDAVLAVNAGAWYGINSESRDDADVLGLAAWVEAAAFPKLAIAQSNAASLLAGQGPSYNALISGTPVDGTYVLVFTGFGLVSPVSVTVTRAAGSPAANTDIGAWMRTALTTALGG